MAIIVRRYALVGPSGSDLSRTVGNSATPNATFPFVVVDVQVDNAVAGAVDTLDERMAQLGWVFSPGTPPPGGGGTLDDAYDFGGPGAGRVIAVDSSTVELDLDGGGTAVNPATTALQLKNATAADDGVQQASPVLAFTGQGWNLAEELSIPVDWALQALPLQNGEADPTVNLTFHAQVDGLGFTRTHQFTDAGAVLAGDGQPDLPAYSFQNNQAIGMYRSGNNIRMYADGVNSAEFNVEGVGIPQNGVSFNPGLYVQGDPNTGLLHDGTPDTLTVLVGDFQPMRWEKVGVLGQTLINVGSLALPALAFNNDKDTGLFSIVVGNIDHATNGVQNLRLTQAGGALPQALMPDGTVGNPAWSFQGDQNTGIRRSAADTMQLVTNGSDKLTIDANVAAGETSLMVSVAGGAPVRVSVGAADSGGVGFRILRIPN